MKREELHRIVSYVNEQLKMTIRTGNSITNDSIGKSYFNEDEFIHNYIVNLEEKE